MDDKKLQDLEKRIKDLEDSSFGTNPLTHPQTVQNLQQQIYIPLSMGTPTFNPGFNGVRQLYFDGANYWLYIFVKGAWKRTQLN